MPEYKVTLVGQEFTVRQGANGKFVMPSSLRQTAGLGTALKPSHEPIILARKPLSERNVAANVLRHGTGAINIGACRVEGVFRSGWSDSGSKASENSSMSGPNTARDPKPDNPAGRWPANLILSHDESCELVGTKRVRGSDRPGHEGKTSPVHIIGPTHRHSEIRHGDADGMEEVEAWSCVEGGVRATFGAVIGGFDVTPFSSLAELADALEAARLLRTPSHTWGNESRRLYETGCALGLQALPSFGVCCPACFRYGDVLFQFVAAAVQASEPRSLDVIARVCRVLRSPRRTRRDLHTALRATLDAEVRPGMSAGSDRSRIVESGAVPPGSDTISPGKSDRTAYSSDAECDGVATVSSNETNRIDRDDVDSCERSADTACTETVIRLIGWSVLASACPVSHVDIVLPYCPVAMLDAQSGELTSGKPVGMKTGGQANAFGRFNGGIPVTGIGDTGGASRFFKVVDCRDSFTDNEACERTLGATSGSRTADGTESGERRGAVSSTSSLKADGSGRCGTDLFQPGTRFTTGTTTKATTPRETSSSSPKRGTTTTTSDSEKITESSGGSSSDDASDVADTVRSQTSSGEPPELIKGTASDAPGPTSPSGEPETGSTTTPTCAPIEHPGASFCRFHYTAKADKTDRDGSKHPTIKPTDLMAYLVRLVTPPGGIVLDPFCGSGPTIWAAREYGFRAIGIDREEEYLRDTVKRLRQGVLL